MHHDLLGYRQGARIALNFAQACILWHLPGAKFSRLPHDTITQPITLGHISHWLAITTAGILVLILQAV